MAASGLEEVDRGWERILLQMTGAAPDLVVDVGAVGSPALGTHDEGGPTNAELLKIHEFGSIRVPNQPPERSSLRSTISAKRAKYETLLARAGKAFFSGRLALRVGLGLIGARVTADVKRTIAAGIPPPLKQATIRQKTVRGKRGTRPLIDTGQLLGSITWLVRRSDQGER